MALIESVYNGCQKVVQYICARQFGAHTNRRMSMDPLSRHPNTLDMVSHRLESVGSGDHVKHVAVFEYPNCTRRFDGSNWTVQPKETTE